MRVFHKSILHYFVKAAGILLRHRSDCKNHEYRFEQSSPACGLGFFIAIKNPALQLPPQNSFAFPKPKQGQRWLLFGALMALLIVFPVRVFAWSQAELSQFEAANKNYREGKFKEAAGAYEELARRHPDAAAFFYNLGNSYHRRGERGPAILAYKRAQRLNPRNQDILYNLRYVQGLGEYRIQDKRNWYVKFGMRMLDYFTEKEVGVLAFGSFLFFMISWTFVLFFRPEASWGWARKTLLFLTLFFGAGFVLKTIQDHVIREAIVMAKDMPVRYGPSDADQVEFKLGEGFSVYVLDEREGWSRIFLVNGESGWVDNHNIAKVLPS